MCGRPKLAVNTSLSRRSAALPFSNSRMHEYDEGEERKEKKHTHHHSVTFQHFFFQVVPFSLSFFLSLSLRCVYLLSASRHARRDVKTRLLFRKQGEGDRDGRARLRISQIKKKKRGKRKKKTSRKTRDDNNPSLSLSLLRRRLLSPTAHTTSDSASLSPHLSLAHHFLCAVVCRTRH